MTENDFQIEKGRMKHEKMEDKVMQYGFGICYGSGSFYGRVGERGSDGGGSCGEERLHQ